MTVVKTGSQWDFKKIKRTFCFGIKNYDTVWGPFVYLTYFVHGA